MLTKKKDSATAKVVDAIATGHIVPLYSQDILDEYKEVLHRKKFAFSEGRILRLLMMLNQYGIEVTPSPTGEGFIDMDDVVFYEVVMEKRDNDAYLITGNIRHFPERDFIVTPAKMMEILSGVSYPMDCSWTKGQKGVIIPYS